MFAYLIEHNRYISLCGIPLVIALAALFSENRRAISWRLVINALILELVLAVVMLKVAAGQKVMAYVADGVKNIYQFADVGINFMFGNLANPASAWGFVFAFKILPVMIFFGALTSLLFHWGVIQYCVMGINRLFQPLLGTSGAETLCAIANSFLGQTESPLLVRHYLKSMTRSEMFVVMVSGMATISGAILVVFSLLGVPTQHLLASCIMSVPASLLMAKIIIPETDTPVTKHGGAVQFERTTANIFDAIATGTLDGLHLALNVGAMLISFLALLALVNYALFGVTCATNTLCVYAGSAWQLPPLTIGTVFGYILSPFAYLLGFTGDQVLVVGNLIGTKIAVNEMVAYIELVRLNLPERTVAIVTYALCGFSNFSCIGIQIGGIGALAPEKRILLSELGVKAVLVAALTNIMSAMIAALLL